MALLKAPSWGLFPEPALFWKTLRPRAAARAAAGAGAGAVVWSAGFWSFGVEVELSCAIPAHTSVRDMAAIASFLRYFECVTLGPPRNLIQLQNYGTLL